MRLWRVLPFDPAAAPDAPGGPLWIPRAFQGTARHDAPEHYGCLYVAESPDSAVAEALAPFRGTGDLDDGLLVRSGRRLALAELELGDALVLVDLDDPTELQAEHLRPSIVATSHRLVTQAYALSIFERRGDAAGFRWWSTLEASWINVTLFDRCLGLLEVARVRPLAIGDASVRAAAQHLWLA